MVFNEQWYASDCVMFEQNEYWRAGWLWSLPIPLQASMRRLGLSSSVKGSKEHIGSLWSLNNLFRFPGGKTTSFAPQERGACGVS